MIEFYIPLADFARIIQRREETVTRWVRYGPLSAIEETDDPRSWLINMTLGIECRRLSALEKLRLEVWQEWLWSLIPEETTDGALFARK